MCGRFKHEEVKMESTLVLIKPDVVKAGLVGRIISFYEDNKMQIDGMYQEVPSQAVLSRHYEEHVGKDFYAGLLAFMTSGPVVVLKLTGHGAVSVVRELNGATNPKKARAGTLRYLYGQSVQQNAVHGSADIVSADRELAIWFPQINA